MTGRGSDDRAPVSAAELASLLDAEEARGSAQIAALTRDFGDIVERSSDAVRDDEHDPEGATVAFERAQVAALLQSAKAKRADIDAARSRLARGEHTACERCGATIPRERHVARPTARTCAACAS